ncbi:phage portal protein [Clostridium botulinum]|nr:phage portal protein [Clostridium botulinum]MCS4472344.1 phage portal protein [Clostridium botulinum]MCS4474844.1 phage portal protein [Clostridium botulinum]
MNIFNKIRNAFSSKNETEAILNDIDLKTINEIFKREGTSENLSEITYFTCIKMLSESLGKLSLKFYQETDNGVIKINNNKVYSLLNSRPNPYMTPSIFWATVEFNRNHYGNACVWCRWFKDKLLDLWILNPKDVKVLADNEGILGTTNAIYYLYTDNKTGKTYTFNEKDILHFKTGVSKDGITGLAVQDILQSSMNGNKASQSFMNKLYESGLTAKAVLEYTGDLNKEAKERLVAGFEAFANGENNTGKIVPVPLGMKLTPLDIKLTDSQFFELKKYSSLQIAAAFGIKPNHLNNYEKSSYANSEMQNLSFYTDTLLFILNQYEQEITFKLLSEEERLKGFYFKFNVNSILRADMKTQMESLATGVNNGIYSIDEARAYLDMPKIDGGSTPIVNGNYIPLTRVGEAYSKGGDK